MTVRRLFVGLLAIAAVCVFVAGVDSEMYDTLSEAPVAYTTEAGASSWSTADSGSTADNVGTLKPTGGNPNAACRVTHSAHSGTAAVACYLWQVVGGTGGTEVYLGIASVSTSTASTIGTDGTYWHGRRLLSYDTSGATHYELRVEAISSGTVSLTAWSFGADSK